MTEKLTPAVVYRVRYTDAAGRTRGKLYAQRRDAEARAEALREREKDGVTLDYGAVVWMPVDAAPLQQDAPRRESSFDPYDFETWKHLLEKPMAFRRLLNTLDMDDDTTEDWFPNFWVPLVDSGAVNRLPDGNDGFLYVLA